MTSGSLQVSVVIPARGVTKELDESLSQLRTVKPPVLEVLVITDHAVAEWWNPPVRLLSHVGPPSEKRDVAARVARGDILAFLDDDAYPRADWPSKALRHFADPLVAAVGGPAITPPHDGFWALVSGAVLTSWLGSGATRLRFWPVGRVRPVDDWPSVNLLVRRDVFTAIGGFDTSFWPGEDTKLCLDIVRTGKRILYDPEAVVYHHRATTPLKHLRQIARYGLHRGHFAKIFPETSRRLAYFLPLGALLGVALLLGAAAARGAFRIPVLALFLVTFAIVVLSGVHEALRARRLAIALCYPPLLVLTHLTYALAFLRGLLSYSLKRYERRAR